MDDGHDLDDPKSGEWADRLTARADDRRKYEGTDLDEHDELTAETQKRLYDVQAYLAKTLDNIEGWRGTWEPEDIHEMLTDALRISLGEGIA